MKFSVRLALWIVLSAGLGFSQVITTEVGTDPPGIGPSQPAVSTPLGQIFANAVDKNGNLYIADYEGNQVFQVAPNGALSLIAGNGFSGFSGDGGPAVSASLKSPKGVAVGSDGTLYIADTGNDRIRAVATDGTVSTFAGNGSEAFSGDGGPATQASLFGPNGLSFDASGNLYFADTRHSRIRKISTAGTITTVAGNGQETYTGEGAATAVALNDPVSVVVDASGNLYIADTLNNRIRKVTNGVISTFAGTGQPGYQDGPASSALVSYPKGLALDSQGNLFFADPGNNRIRKIQSNVVSTIAGNGALAFGGDGGNPLAASLAGPSSIAFNAAGDLYIADTTNDRIRRLSASTNTISTVAGNGAFRLSPNGVAALDSFLSNPQDVKVGPDGLLYIVDTENNRILRVNMDNTVVTVAGNGDYGFSGDGALATTASLNLPRHIAFDSAGNMYIADSLNLRIRRVNPQGIITTIAGNGQPGYTGDNGPALNATLNYPTDMACDSLGNVYIADQLNNVIRVVKNGTISTFAGNGKAAFGGDEIPAIQTSLNEPYAVYVDPSNNVYIADIYNFRIRKVTKDGVIHTVAGNGSVGYVGDNGPALNAELSSPSGVSIDADGDLFISDAGNNVIRVVNANQIITTFAGNGSSGYTGDGGAATAATMNFPIAAVPDGQGGLHIADTFNNRIRRVLPSQPAFTVAPASISFSASAGGPVTSPQGIQVASTVTGLGFTVTASDPWLKASVASGNMPTAVEISVDPSTLSEQTYQGTVTITSGLASVPTRVVNVSANVGPSETPQLAINNQTINFSFTQTASPGKATLTVSNTGGGSVPITVTSSTNSGGQWLSVSPTTGTVTPSTPASLNIVATPGTLAAGTYTGTIVIGSASSSNIQVAVSMAISPSVSKIVLSQTGLTFVGVSQGGSVLPQSIGILNVGDGVMQWTAKAVTLTGSGWLTLSATSGTVNRPFLDVSFTNVGVNAQSLSTGTYYGSIQVSASGADNSPQSVLVVLNVLAPGSNPGPAVNPTGLVFTGVSGAENPGSQNITIANVTSNPVQYGSSATYVGTGNWLTYSPITATINPDQPVNIVVQPDITTLASGTLRAALTLVLSDGSIRTVSVLSVVAPASAATGQLRGQDGPRAGSAGSCQPTKLLPVFTQLGAGQVVTAGWPVAITASVVDDCGSPMTSGSVVLSFSDGDPALSLISLQDGQWSGTWQPRNGSGQGVTVTLLAKTASSLTGTVQTTVGAGGNQQLPNASGGVTNAVAQSGGPLAPGEIVMIKGSSLADHQAISTTSPLQQQLAGASVLIGGRLASLLYVDPTQVVGLVPADLPINSSQQVLLLHGTGAGIPIGTIISSTQPAIFTENGSGNGQALAYKAGILADASNPVKGGDNVVIYCAGLGGVDAGGAVTNPVTVTIGGAAAQVSYAGLALSADYPTAGPPNILGVSTELGGLYQITVTVPNQAPNGSVDIVLNSAGQTSQAGVTVAIGLAGSVPKPLVNAVVNGASFKGGGIVPGEIATLFGSNLTGSTGINSTSGLPLPNQFLNTSITVNGAAAPLFAIVNVNGQQQINFQVPWEVASGQNVAIAESNSGTASASISVAVLAAQPGIFNYSAGGNTFGAILHANYQLVDTANPAKPGETILIYCTGLGAVSSPPADGAPGNGQITLTTPTVTIGSTKAMVSFSGLAPGFVGLYQINAEVPPGLKPGNQPVVITDSGASSNSVLLPVGG